MQEEAGYIAIHLLVACTSALPLEHFVCWAFASSSRLRIVVGRLLRGCLSILAYGVKAAVFTFNKRLECYSSNSDLQEPASNCSSALTFKEPKGLASLSAKFAAAW